MIVPCDFRETLDSGLDSDQARTANAYWLARFGLPLCDSAFPPDRGPSGGSASCAWVERAISPRIWSSFLDVCKREGINHRHGILGLLIVLLHRYTLSEAIEVGMHDGPLVPVRTEIVSSLVMRDCLSAAARAVEEAAASACSWEALRTCAIQAGLSSDRPLFRIALSVSDREEAAIPMEARAQCDVLFSLTPQPNMPALRAEYKAARYKPETIDSILKQIAWLMESLPGILETQIDRIALCSPDDARSSVLEIAGDRKEFQTTQCMHSRFEEQAKRTPDAVAVVMPGPARQEVTYGSLNAAANQLAHYLKDKGVGPETLVGLYLDRTPDLIIAMLAIVKAGGAYLPIDLSYPPDRIAFMISDAEAPMVIADSKTALLLPETSAKVVRIDADKDAWEGLSSENLDCGAGPQSLLYSIFTSGSTGKPKGVLITHRNVSRLFDATDEWFHFGESDAWTFFHSIAFDFSVWEIWGALIYGGRIVIVPYADSRSPESFYGLLADEGVTVLNQTPSAFRQLVGVDEGKPEGMLDKLRVVIFGGEALNLQSLAPWFKKYGDTKPQLVNMYGITETTVHVTYRPLKQSDLTEAPGSVIGRAIPDLTLYVLDSGFQPVPVGVPGEMFVGGAGVARGYLKREALTAERFIANPFSKETGEPLYRSGDLARRLPGDDIEYLGRADQQVKIRGFRIELGEVQSALARLPSVREAFVMAIESCDGEKDLVAYVVPAEGETLASDKLRHQLRSALPIYMVPAKFVFLIKLPLTGNGKIDRAALPAARAQRPQMETPFHPPQSEMERNIAKVYQDVLNLESIGIDDNFFDLGGDSLRLAEAHSRLERLIGRRFSAAELFVHTTVRELAKWLHGDGRHNDAASDVLARAKRQREALSAGRSRRT